MAPKELKKITDTIWEIPTTFKQGMQVPARIYATEKLVKEMDEGVFNQVTNVATLPGLLKYAYCMPDGHIFIVRSMKRQVGLRLPDRRSRGI